jgi:hypothetical protein
MGTFAARTRELQDRIGHGKLEMKVTVDQVYAAAQETGTWVTGPNAGKVIHHHPHGGKTHFLGGSLMEQHPRYLETLARQTLEVDGLHRAAHENVESLAREVFDNAPREFEDLRNSAHPTVTDNGVIVYDRPPVRERLSKEALKEKNRRRRVGEGPG